MPVEFIGMIGAKPGSETDVRRGPAIDHGYLRAFAQAHEQAGFDRVLIGYGSSQPDGLQVAAYAAAHTERLTFLIAHRPGFVAPTVAARAFATLDQLTLGRIAVHVISGGNDAEQRRDGDTLRKDERYARTDEYLQILDRAWRSETPFDFAGRYYAFEDFVSEVRPWQQPRIPLYFGGASEAAIDVGARHADVFALWGEPLAETAEQIARVRAAAEAAGREEPPRISVSFRPILGDTDEEAWERAHRILRGRRGEPGRRARDRQALRPGQRRAGERRLAAPAGRRGARRAARPRTVDADRQGRRRLRQHHRARRIARDRRAGAAGLRRHRRDDPADPRVRPARGRRRLRPAPPPASCGGRSRAGTRSNRLAHTLPRVSDETISTGEAMVRALVREGVDTVFGIPGVQTYELFDALGRASEIRVVAPRHEQAASYMAYGYAKSTGRTGVYSVVPGPGVLNASGGLCTAYGASAPLLCLTSEVPTPYIGSGLGHLHELPDQLATLRTLTKWAQRIGHPVEAPGLVTEGLRRAASGRPRPVALEAPWDVLTVRAPVTAGRGRGCGGRGRRRRSTPTRSIAWPSCWPGRGTR